ncbi:MULTISPECIES: diacylglycerol/lipid kinase family protein [unclassified Janthinobacterium]|uniref:diacylglycerol/lipid kinase family protein n=1 Tax=unclassified Janthinobacterium TaxID=2610881 RepID=UPI000349B40B|nr:diacylglycerol kinase family protein [Janthinobacterium sp. CG_S6]MEC5163819.1 diacylglycerol kinase family enzyme [Janthinobacterium sp. CG_S6]
MIPIVVIINAGAGCGYAADWTEQLDAKFRANGFEAAITLAESGADMIATAQAAVAAGAAMVVAGGGDGTINAVASALVDSGVAFGVLPLGTLNHFAKDLRIPLPLDEAIANLAQGAAALVDVGEVNGRVFLNNSSLGLYPDIVRDREKQQRRLGRGKWLAFAWAALAALRRYPFLSVRLSVNGQRHARSTPFVFIGNNEYVMQGFNIGERARLDAGQLSLYVAQRPGRLGLVRLAFHALSGRLAEQKDVDVLLATEMDIETRHKRLRVATDGEVTVMATPLRYRIRRGALRVLVPRPAGAAGDPAANSAGPFLSATGSE